MVEEVNGHSNSVSPLIIPSGKAAVVLGAQWGDEGKGIKQFVIN